MISRRRFLKTTAGVLCAGVLSSCAKSPTPTPQIVKQTVIVEGTPKVVEKLVTAVPPTASPKPTGVKGLKGIFWGLQYDPHVAAYKRLADLFQKKTGATLEIQPQGWPIETKVIAALAADNQPDVLCILPQQIVSFFIQKVLVDAGELVFKPQNIDPHKLWATTAIDSWLWDGHYYGVAVELSGLGSVVNVPVEDMKTAGLAGKYPPTSGKDIFDSYEQMWELAKALQIKDSGGVKRWGLSSQGYDGPSYLGVLQNLLDESGKQVFDPATGKFNIDSDEGVKALELLVDTPVKMGIERQLDKNGIDAALAGQVALVRGNGTPATKEGYDLGYHYELVGAPPTKPGKPPVYFDIGTWGFTAPVRAKNMDVAIEFLKMMCTTEGQREYCKIYGGMSQVGYIPLLGVYDHFENPDPKSPIVQSAMRYQKVLTPLGRTFNVMAAASCVNLVAGFAEVRQQKMTPKEGVKAMQAEVEAKYKQFQADIAAQKYN